MQGKDRENQFAGLAADQSWLQPEEESHRATGHHMEEV